MTRRIILILIGALVILALMFALWFWLFGKQTEVGEQLENFGTAADRGGGTVSPATGSNTTDVLIGGTTNTSGASGGSNNIQTPLYVTPTYENPDFDSPSDTDVEDEDFFDDDFDGVPDIAWLNDVAGIEFDPTPINQLNNVNIEGTPYFVPRPTSLSDGTEIGLGDALAGVAGGCVAQYAARKLTVGVLNKVKSVVGGLLSDIPILGDLFGGGDQVSDADTHTNQEVDSFFDCMVRSLARVAIQQITAQTVAWINSGFNGEPAFVQDFGKFFTDVADRAAGEVIQGSDLAFLCSPFQLQVRIAIAQSYARRDLGSTQSCTLTSVVGNVENFMNGTFSEGGWPGLISFTTVPTNNPFGAYASAQVLLNNRIANAQELASLKVSPGGFLSREECTYPSTPGGMEECKTVTPGSTFESSLEAVFKTNLDSLQLADSVDEILNALVNSLVINVFQKGLAGVTGSDVGGYQTSPRDTEAIAEAEALLEDLQAAAARAQEYGSIMQGSISDLQNAQGNLVELQNCWVDNGDTSRATVAGNKVEGLEDRVLTYNAKVLHANVATGKIQEIHSQALLATKLKHVRDAAKEFTKAQTSGALITNTRVVNAQQDRTTLQAEMAALNQQTAAELNQCNAS